MIEALSRLFRTAFFRILASALGFLVVVLTSRYLGPQGRGVFALFMNVVITVVAFSGSFQSSVVYYVGSRKRSFKFYLSSLQLISLAVAILSILSVFLFPQIRPYAAALIFAVFFYNMVLYLEGYAYAVDNLTRANLFKSLPSIVSFIFIFLILVVFHMHRVSPVIWSWALSFLIVLVIMRTFPFTFSFPHKRALYELFVHGTFVALSTFISRIFYRVDFFYLSRFLGDAPAGIYSVAMTVADINFLLFNMITTAFMGKLVGEESRKYLKYGILYILLMELPFVLFLLVTGRFLIPWIFGEGFSEAFTPALILSIAIIFYTMGSMVAIYMNVKLGKTHIPFLIALVGLFIKGLLAYPLVMNYGMMGGAYSSLVAYALTFLAFVYAYSRFT